MLLGGLYGLCVVEEKALECLGAGLGLLDIGNSSKKPLCVFLTVLAGGPWDCGVGRDCSWLCWNEWLLVGGDKLDAEPREGGGGWVCTLLLLGGGAFGGAALLL
jgi:hypothetical protein